MFKYQPRVVEQGPNKGRMFMMYKTYLVSNPKKYNMTHASFSEDEAIKAGLDFQKEYNLTEVKTVRI